ncbi:hypothetical protein THAOC_13083 [Thalassiosira oceanica]|uniref:Uncharacterized protein n=1 Tax=Thalassiosira oceanica TaxID=159749 RepID=K0SM21_THAOC|nr:hypothetical protein THAOC_13083 [Thalassiosira oceanica]|eukprot:EJK66019.1 hypothetical protein THAOC_13083 [Thalassiosira oceanica]
MAPTAKIRGLVPSALRLASVHCNNRHASGVRGDDGVYPARPSALHTSTCPLGRSVASANLKQPSMHHAADNNPSIVIVAAAPMCTRLMCD